MSANMNSPARVQNTGDVDHHSLLIRRLAEVSKDDRRRAWFAAATVTCISRRPVAGPIVLLSGHRAGSCVRRPLVLIGMSFTREISGHPPPTDADSLSLQ